MGLTRVDGSMLEDGSIPPEKLTEPADMSKADYDSDNDGKVDHAELADAAPWAGITGKPAIFPSHETIVTVDTPERFTGFNAGPTVKDCLDGISDALNSSSIVVATGTVPNNDDLQFNLGAAADFGQILIEYLVARGTETQAGRIRILVDPASVSAAIKEGEFEFYEFGAGSNEEIGATFTVVVGGDDILFTVAVDNRSATDASVRLECRKMPKA